MTLPPYILAVNQDLVAPIILYTRSPYIFGHVWRHKKYDDYLAFLQECKSAHALVPGYKIVVTHAGSLTQKIILVDPNIGQTINNIMQGMAAFYLADQIGAKPRNFEEFKL